MNMVFDFSQPRYNEVNIPSVSMEELDDILVIDKQADVLREQLEEGDGVEISMFHAKCSGSDDCTELARAWVNNTERKLRVVLNTRRNRQVDMDRISTEGMFDIVKDSAKDVFEAVSKAVRVLWDKLDEFAGKLGNSNEALHEAASELKKHIEQDKFHTGNIAVIDDEILAGKFAHDTMVGLRRVKDLVRLHTMFIDKSINLVNAINDTIGITRTTGSIDKNIDEDSLKPKLVEIYKKAHPAIDALAGFMVPDGSLKLGINFDKFNEREVELEYPQRDSLYGGKQVLISAKIQPPNPEEDHPQSSFDLTFSTKTATYGGQHPKLHVLSKQEMLDVCNMVLALTSKNAGLINNLEKANQAVGKLLAEIDKLSGSNHEESQSDEVVVTKIKQSLAFIRKFVAVMGTKSRAYAGMIAGLNSGLCESCLRYVKASMNANKPVQSELEKDRHATSPSLQYSN